jgi:hypothetical protein
MALKRKLEMKYLCTLLLLIHSIFFVFADDRLVREYSSPNGQNKIFYEGDEHFGYGIFYKDKIDNRNAIIAMVVSTFIPEIKWHGDDIAEIWCYGGPGVFYSNIYLFKYNLLTPNIYYVLDVLPQEELIIHTNDLSSICISSINPYKPLQTLQLDGISGQKIIYGGIKVEVTAEKIIITSKIELFTKDLIEPLVFIFDKEF